VASFEKAILDAEMLQDMAAMLMPLPGGEDPALLDWRRGRRHGEDEPPAQQRANRVWKQLLAEYEAPFLEPSRREAIEDYIARRKSEGGVKAASHSLFTNPRFRGEGRLKREAGPQDPLTGM